MAEERRRADSMKKQVVLRLPGMDAVGVRQNITYKSGETGNLEMDLYYPTDSKDSVPQPAVLFVIGYSDRGAQALFGCRFKETEPFSSWARLVAASGLVAVTYSTGSQPPADIRDAIGYVARHATELGIDATKLALWASSGHVPTALSALIDDGGGFVKCAVLCYGYTLDAGGTTYVADAAKMFRFSNASEGRSVNDLPGKVPLLIARAGRDECPHLNDALDRLVTDALGRNLPLTVVNHPTAPHAFDIADDSEETRAIVRQIITFLKDVLMLQSEHAV